MTNSEKSTQLDTLRQQELQLIHSLGEVRGAMRVIQPLPSDPDPSPSTESPKQD